MKNLAEEWARALVEDLNATPPAWKPASLTFATSATAEAMVRPCVLITGEENARSHPRIAVGTVTLSLHWHRNDGSPAEAREVLRLAALEADSRRDSITIGGGRMTYYIPDPETEEGREDGWVFRAHRSVRFRAGEMAAP